MTGHPPGSHGFSSARLRPIVVFDLDGTLLRGTTVSLLLAECLGRGDPSRTSSVLRFVEDWCARHGYSMRDVAAIGDSRSDVPLFRRASLSIALNATADARAAATHVLDTDDLRDVLALLAR